MKSHKTCALLLIFFSAFLYTICFPGICNETLEKTETEKTAQVRDRFEKFKNIHHAGKSLEISLNNKVSFPKFKTLLQNFSTEIATVAQKNLKTEEEKNLLRLYSNAYTFFQDSATLWGYSLHETATPPKGKLSINKAAKSILKKYNIPLHYEGGRSIPKYSITVMFEKALKKLKEADIIIENRK